MPASSGGIEIGYLAGKHPGRIGWLLSPGDWKTPPDWLPYAIDNGEWTAHLNAELWDEDAFYKHLENVRCRANRPRWIAVPDSVADRDETLRRWEQHAPRVAKYGCPLAFVAQNGMTPRDVPGDAAVVFVGGTTEWKWTNLAKWTAAFPRVHVGRVNGYEPLWVAHRAGAESCDGTGWNRGGPERLAGLARYLAESDGSGREQAELF